MAKIDELTLEIKKYTTIYNDILVGMHADMNDYKKKVVSQASNTTKAVNLIKDSFQELREKKSEVDKMVEKIILLHSETLEAKTGLVVRLAEFKKESKLISTKLIHLGEDINQIKDELTDTINANHKELNLEIINLKKSNKIFKVVVVLSFLVLIAFVGFLMKNIL